jgi:hypothetical protein
LPGFQEVIGEGFDDVVERVVAVRQMLQEVIDISPAAFARRAYQLRRHLQLIEGLVPDIVEPLGLRHSRPDAGIDEIKEK